MDCINAVSWDRYLIPSTDYESFEVYAFSDASEAYASVVFLRVVYDDYVKVSFLVGKCKIAPQRETLTIPKLELIAACLFVRLVQKFICELHLEIHRIVYWIDAASVLDLINNQDKRFKLFEANWLSFIHHYSKPSLG